eukprot:243353_1
MFNFGSNKPKHNNITEPISCVPLTHKSADCNDTSKHSEDNIGIDIAEYPNIDNTRIQAYLAVLSATLIAFVSGALNSFGNYLPYIASYLASENGNTRQDYKYYIDACSWIYSIQIISLSCFMSVGGKIEQIIGPRYTAIVGSFIFLLGYSITYFTSHWLWGMYLTFGVMVGIGIGIVYTTPMIVGMKWFPQNKGLITGIIMCG